MRRGGKWLPLRVSKEHIDPGYETYINRWFNDEKIRSREWTKQIKTKENEKKNPCIS